MATNKNFIVKNGLEVAGNITVTGNITQAGMAMPASDGSAGQFLKTDGSGNLSWDTVVSNFTISDGSNTDVVNTGEALTFVAGTGITTTVSNNTVTIAGVVGYTDSDAVAAIEGATNLTIDGGTLYIDTSNNYIGIGDTSPQQKLDVAGNIGVNGSEVITSSGQYVGTVADSAVTIGGSLVGPLSNLKVQYGTAYSGTPVQGSFFFDSLNQKLKVYTGSAFVDAVPAGTGGSSGTETDANTTFRKYSYTTSSSTNAISGADDNSETLTYVTDGTENVEVFVNGIKQVEGATRDYVATTGTSVTFTYNIPSGSSVDIQVYELLTNDAYYLKSDVYTKTETNTQISTGLSSYLPLTGGTVTGTVSVDRLHVGTNNLSTETDIELGGRAIIKTDGAEMWFANADDTSGGFYWGAGGTGSGGNSGVTTNMVLSYDGKLGVGTSSPSSPLHIRSNPTISAGTNILLVENYATGEPAVIGMKAVADNAGQGNAGAIYFDAGADGTAADNIIGFNADHQTDNNYDVVIKGDGLVGIGVNNPLAALHIQHSTKPQLLLDGGSDVTGDIVVPDGEILQVGHWNNGTSTYTPRITVSASGNTNIGSGRSDPGESVAQGLSPEAGRGVLTAPWVATSCIEAVTEMGAGSVGISLGQNGMTGGGQPNLQDEVAIWCDGGHVLEVRGTHANNTLASVVVYGESYTTVTGSSSTNPNSGAMNFRVTGDSDGLAIYNVSSGDYSLCNTQQGNGIIFYDGSGGMRGYYNSTQMYEVNSAGFSTSSDIRLKETIGALDIDATNIVNNLDLIAYHPKSSQNDVQGDQNETIYGFSAQELYALDNNLVSKGADDLDNDVDKLGVYSVKTTSMHALLLKALQEANAKIADLEARIKTLENN